jgi:hypothetical protein
MQDSDHFLENIQHWWSQMNIAPLLFKGQSPTKQVGIYFRNPAPEKAGRKSIFDRVIQRSQEKPPSLTPLKCRFHAGSQLRPYCSPAPRSSKEQESRQLGGRAKRKKKHIAGGSQPMPKVKICAGS